MKTKNYTKEIELQIENHFERIVNLLKETGRIVEADKVEDFAYDLLESLKSCREE